MTVQRVVFRESPVGVKTLTVDGADMSRVVGPDALIRIEPNCVTTIEVSLIRVAEADFVGEVRLRAEDVDALVALGWTPPKVTV